MITIIFYKVLSSDNTHTYTNVLGNDLEVDLDLEVQWRTCNSCLAEEVRCDSRKRLQATMVFPPQYYLGWTT